MQVVQQAAQQSSKISRKGRSSSLFILAEGRALQPSMLPQSTTRKFTGVETGSQQSQNYSETPDDVEGSQSGLLQGNQEQASRLSQKSNTARPEGGHTAAKSGLWDALGRRLSVALTQSDEGMHQSGRQKFRRTSNGLDLNTEPALSSDHPLRLDGEECPFSSRSA